MSGTQKGVLTIDDHLWQPDTSDQNYVTITDKGGHSFLLHVFEGIYYPPTFSVRYLKQVRGFKIRPDDIYFTAYPRSGANWTFERMAMLINGKAETITRAKDNIEMYPESYFDKLPSPRIINSHMKMSDSPAELLTKKCKVVYSMRDPKDIIVSMYDLRYGRGEVDDRYTGSFGEYLQLFISGNVEMNGFFDHCRDAEKYFEEHPEVPVYVHIYEESQKDPLKAVKELSDFLGLPRDDNLCQDITEKCGFSKMKVDKEDYTLKIDGENFLYRKGKTGDWKNWFTEELLDEYYKVYEEKMAGSRFYHRYSRSATS